MKADIQGYFKALHSVTGHRQFFFFHANIFLSLVVLKIVRGVIISIMKYCFYLNNLIVKKC